MMMALRRGILLCDSQGESYFFIIVKQQYISNLNVFISSVYFQKA